MKKVIIKRLNGSESGSQFDNDQEMQAWIDDNIANNSWGKPAMWISEHDAIEKQIEGSISSRRIGDHLEYYVPAEYAVEISEVVIDPMDALIAKALQDQEKGKKILAIVHALNTKKFNYGLLDQNAFLAMLDNSELKYIERLLLNGSLETAKHFMSKLDETYFSKEEKAAIIELF